MPLPHSFASLNLTAYSKDSQGNYLIPASALDDNFTYLLSRTWVSNSAPTDTDKYCFWLDTSATPNVLKIWNGTGWTAVSTALTVRKNSGSNIGSRPRINFIEGNFITFTISDDAVDNEIDITCTASAYPNFVSFSPLVFGDGSLGNVTISSNTTLSAGTNGIKVLQYNNLTVNSGVYLEGNSADKVLVILVKDTLTINGTIRMDGRGGAGGAGGDVAYGGGAGAFGGGGGGGTGAGDRGGGGGGGGTAGSDSYFGGGGGGGAPPYWNTGGWSKGKGGDGDTNAGGSGYNYMGNLLIPIHFEIARYLYGGGGGGGRSYGANGGNGGGVIWIEARNIVWGSSGLISCNGTNGAGGSGGGGGGAGGFIQAVYESKTGTSNLRVNGGAGGASSVGRNGGNGANGLAVEFKIIP